MQKNKQKTSQHGGPRPGSGRPALEKPATIQFRLEAAEKSAFVRAAQRSAEGTLTNWILAAAREKLARGKEET